MLVLQGDKIRIWTELCSLPGLKLPREEEGASLLARGSSLCSECANLLHPSPWLSCPGYSHANCDNHVNLSQLFNAAVLSSPWIAIAAVGCPCFSVVFWLFDLTLLASTCWKWITSLELHFATVDRIVQVSFLVLFCLTESETTDSVPSDEETAEVRVFWDFSTLEQGLKNNVLRYSSPS